eukprot:878423-Lingulodinium_polyedra.AAC.1
MVATLSCAWGPAARPREACFVAGVRDRRRSRCRAPRLRADPGLGWPLMGLTVLATPKGDG